MDGDSSMDPQADAAAAAAAAATAAATAAAEYKPASVVVYLAGQPAVYVDLHALNTYADMRSDLTSVHGIDMENKVIVDEHDNIKSDEEKLAGNVPSMGLAVKEQLPITVQHAGFEFPMHIIHNSSKSTITQLKTALEAQRTSGAPFTSTPLTWKGYPVSDEQRVDQLEDIGRADELGLKLVGHKSLVVHDLDLGEQLQADLHTVTDNMTLRDVLMTYQTQQRRHYLHQPILARYADDLTAESIGDLPESQRLQQLQTVYDAALESGSTLALKTHMFEVVLKEQSELDRARNRNKAVAGAASSLAAAGADVPGVRVHVFDWWKVRQLKDAYSTAVSDALGPSDQLYLDPAAAAGGAASYSDDLDDGDRLYKHSVREHSGLIVKREDFTAPVCHYICADCGNDVKLKQRDAVRCRECGHRIVFKKRIQKPCQYLCR